ncbi:hypothetical protein LIER_43676 [Lithospermum erythrorhizon]|uniref:Uncharacterized protein n=1 Tax=Lithospermum erythrorhizon TaxID=34254 RepID=A0AAV3QJU3_LITER
MPFLFITSSTGNHPWSSLHTTKDIFLGMFWCQRTECRADGWRWLDGRTYCYPDMLNFVEVRNDYTVYIPDPPNKRITTCTDLKEISRSLKYMVIGLVNKECISPVPTTVGSNKVMECGNFDILRKYAFYITLNPVIYNMDECLSISGQNLVHMES